MYFLQSLCWDIVWKNVSRNSMKWNSGFWSEMESFWVISAHRSIWSPFFTENWVYEKSPWITLKHKKIIGELWSHNFEFQRGVKNWGVFNPFSRLKNNYSIPLELSRFPSFWVAALWVTQKKKTLYPIDHVERTVLVHEILVGLLGLSSWAIP